MRHVMCLSFSIEASHEIERAWRKKNPDTEARFAHVRRPEHLLGVGDCLILIYVRWRSGFPEWRDQLEIDHRLTILKHDPWTTVQYVGEEYYR
jgi:hypothetical protein